MRPRRARDAIRRAGRLGLICGPQLRGARPLRQTRRRKFVASAHRSAADCRCVGPL